MAKTAADAVKNYVAGMAGAATKYTQGVQGVTESPTAKAAQSDAESRYIQGVQQSVSSGKRAQKLMAVSLQQWKDAATSKGAARLATGAQAAQPKVQAHFQAWMPIYAQASAAAHALPKGGMANALARVQAAMQVMMSAAGKA